MRSDGMAHKVNIKGEKCVGDKVLEYSKMQWLGRAGRSSKEKWQGSNWCRPLARQTMPLKHKRGDSKMGITCAADTNVT